MLISHINRNLLSTELLNIFLETFGLTVKAGSLLHDARADVAEFLFDLLCRFEGGIGFAAVSGAIAQSSDISTGDGDGVDGGSRCHPSACAGRKFSFGQPMFRGLGDVRNTVTRINHSTYQSGDSCGFKLEELATPTQCRGPEVTYWFHENPR